ncbi:hypothetical protein [Natronorubrum daqingense]|uniref:Cox cluster protein n=1 Tax=Natronorubrum daqingense TaxID=588898 RepID=A0A1N6YFX9_9EURY|nr:hypothetical protein [Natronorubrum daqingense]APX95680.1 hypothetical protein BB347_03080 [Natronorubrum daqingense]SIR13458.1 hypothetical protein SAMN05421809_0429 [Natronorubrum daqingense]
MSVDREPGNRRRFVGTLLAATAVATVGGALLGFVLPTAVGIEELVVLEMAVPITPSSVGLYAGVTVGVFLLTLGLVVAAVSHFDDETV